MATGAEPVAFGWLRAATKGLTFRPAVDADLPLLRRVYASSRSDELATVPWTDEQKSAFIDMQFRAQHEHYRLHYPDMMALLIFRNEAPAGRLYLQRADVEHHIVDIAILPEHRRHGAGTALMLDLLDEAAAAGKPMTIHVEKFNPAHRLYARLGFQKIDEHGVYELMRWSRPA